MEDDTKANEVDILKRQLLDALQPTQRGVTTTLEQREEIDRLIEALKPCELRMMSPEVFVAPERERHGDTFWFFPGRGSADEVYAGQRPFVRGKPKSRLLFRC